MLGNTIIPSYENAIPETTGVVRSMRELRLQGYEQASMGNAEKGHSRSRDEKENTQIERKTSKFQGCKTRRDLLMRIDARARSVMAMQSF